MTVNGQEMERRDYLLPEQPAADHPDQQLEKVCIIGNATANASLLQLRVAAAECGFVYAYDRRILAQDR